MWQKANEHVKRATSKFPYPSFLVFETPNYKSSYGAISHPLEAEKALTKVKNTYPAAFVVAPY